MERVYVKDLSSKKDGEEVLLKGWVHKIYDLGHISFVRLRDKTGIVQLVLTHEESQKLRLEMCIEAYGAKVSNAKAVNGIEVQVSSLKVIGKAYYDELPFEINRESIDASLEAQLDHRVISLRNMKIRDIFKIQEEIQFAFRCYLKERNFTEIHTPKIIASGTEGGSEMFTVDYFDHRAFLAQSPQFYKQMMVGAGFERVFEIGHAYRAELHNTYRHLNEYVSMDLEMAFIKDETEIMDLEEGFMKYLFKYLKKTCSKILEEYDSKLDEDVKIPRIRLKDAQDIIFKEYGKRSPIGNLDNEGEKLIAKYVKEKYGSDFVFLTKYTRSKRPMYTMPDDEDKETTKSFDLIYKGLEITTGGQRINDYKELLENIKRFNMKTEEFEFYTENFRYGMPPHGGLAIGLERLTMKILNLDNIREASLLPRDMKRITP